MTAVVGVFGQQYQIRSMYSVYVEWSAKWTKVKEIPFYIGMNIHVNLIRRLM